MPQTSNTIGRCCVVDIHYNVPGMWEHEWTGAVNCLFLSSLSSHPESVFATALKKGLFVVRAYNVDILPGGATGNARDSSSCRFAADVVVFRPSCSSCLVLLYVVKNTRVRSIGYTGTMGIIGGPTERTEMSGTVTEVTPNLPYRKCLVPVLRSYRTVPDCSVED